jgi:p-cumate 2,3-dioxygenase beta subunit
MELAHHHGRTRRLHRRLSTGSRRPAQAGDRTFPDQEIDTLPLDTLTPASTTFSRQDIEDFLYAEAEMLDEWRLDDWLALFDEERGGFYIPATDTPESDHNTALFLIADDMVRLRSRVSQLMSGLTWAENPRSRTCHMVSNVRIAGMEDDALVVKANFVVYRMRFQNIDPYIGKYRYKLLPAGDTFKILERRAILDLEALRPHGKVSFIV